MTDRISSLQAALVSLLLLNLSGCGRTPPPLTEVEGVVTLDGKPLPHAQVEFIPDLKHFGAEVISRAVTDEQGRYRLTCHSKSQPGAVVAKHKVLVSEGPVPDEYRKPDHKSQALYAAYVAKLKNRPIPEKYGVLIRSPLVLEVTPDQKTYAIKLIRP